MPSPSSPQDPLILTDTSLHRHTHTHTDRDRDRHRQRHGRGHAAGEFPAYQPPRCKTAYSSHTIRRIRYIRPCRRRFRCAVRAHWCGEEGVQGPGAGWGIGWDSLLVSNRYVLGLFWLYVKSLLALKVCLPRGMYSHLPALSFSSTLGG